jgi:Histidine kinase
MIDQARMSVSNLTMPAGPVVSSRRPPVPVDAHWNDVWLAVTPIWAVLATGRVVFYALERIRYPADVPPVIADAIEALLLWPAAVLGCYLTIRVWRRHGFSRAWLLALGSTVVFGLLARPAYAVGSLLNSADAQSRQWLTSFYTVSPLRSAAVYPWISNTVEYGVLYLSCMAVMVGYFSFMGLANERRLRNSLELEVGQARLRTLRAQLSPHFLFNSLNSIVGLSDRQPAAQLLVTQLSDLLRRTLRASEQEEHELFEELTYVEEYLEIEQTRQPSRVDWRINVDAGCARAAVPTLILIPLVENAVTHGLRGGMQTVAIDINVWRTRDELHIQVGNTCSVSPAARDMTREGLGLRNVKARLDMLFGHTATFRADRTDVGRFEAQIGLPLRESRATAFREDPPCV